MIYLRSVQLFYFYQHTLTFISGNPFNLPVSMSMPHHFYRADYSTYTGGGTVIGGGPKFREAPPYPFRAIQNGQLPSYFTANFSRDVLLQYPGSVIENIMPMQYLDKALAYLNGQTVPDSVISQLFYYIRDRRYFPNTTVTLAPENKSGGFLVPPRRKSIESEFLRRISWLYPDDGATDIMPIGPKTIHKIFLFGKPLNVSTKFSSSGWHSWVYHIASFMRSPTQGYVVLDPSLDHFRPLPVKEWIIRQLGGRRSIEQGADILRGFAITNRFVFIPAQTQSCDVSQSVFDPQNAFLDPYLYLVSKGAVDEMILKEWSRIVQLGMDPTKLLGEFPPWNEQTMQFAQGQFG